MPKLSSKEHADYIVLIDQKICGLGNKQHGIPGTREQIISAISSIITPNAEHKVHEEAQSYIDDLNELLTEDGAALYGVTPDKFEPFSNLVKLRLQNRIFNLQNATEDEAKTEEDENRAIIEAQTPYRTTMFRNPPQQAAQIPQDLEAYLQYETIQRPRFYSRIRNSAISIILKVGFLLALIYFSSTDEFRRSMDQLEPGLGHFRQAMEPLKLDFDILSLTIMLGAVIGMCIQKISGAILFKLLDPQQDPVENDVPYLLGTRLLNVLPRRTRYAEFSIDSVTSSNSSRSNSNELIEIVDADLFDDWPSTRFQNI